MNRDGIAFLKNSMQIFHRLMADLNCSVLNQTIAVRGGLTVEEQEVFDGLSLKFIQMKERDRSGTGFCIHAITVADL